jgi:hypothetical protein
MRYRWTTPFGRHSRAVSLPTPVPRRVRRSRQLHPQISPGVRMPDSRPKARMVDDRPKVAVHDCTRPTVPSPQQLLVEPAVADVHHSVETDTARAFILDPRRGGLAAATGEDAKPQCHGNPGGSDAHNSSSPSEGTDDSGCDLIATSVGPSQHNHLCKLEQPSLQAQPSGGRIRWNRCDPTSPPRERSRRCCVSGTTTR